MYVKPYLGEGNAVNRGLLYLERLALSCDDYSLYIIPNTFAKRCVSSVYV